ncbi:MAG: glycosyltransferase family 4 protein [Clostridia bacterium]|nr:glycosyltransferase family 4 protein [Clostridia bacterium]
MKILFVTNSCRGMYMFRRELVSEFLKTDTVVISAPRDDRFADFEKMGCKMIDTDLSRHGKNVFREFFLLKKYNEILSAEKPDVVLTFTAKPNIYLPKICKRKNVKCIVNVAGLGGPFEKGKIVKNIFLKVYFSSLKRASFVFFQNEVIKKLFLDLGLEEEKCAILCGSGVNTDCFCAQDYPQESENITFLFAGRIVKDKGIDELLFCAKQIKEKYPSTQFEIAGEFENGKYIEAFKKAQKDGTVDFLGFQEDMRPLYKKAWAVIVPSYHEGLSNVCLEAASSARPVIASDIPGCRETFEDGKSGFVFEVKNQVALTEAVEKFIRLDYKEKVQMGLYGREKVQREFDRQSVVSAYKSEIL